MNPWVGEKAGHIIYDGYKNLCNIQFYHNKVEVHYVFLI